MKNTVFDIDHTLCAVRSLHDAATGYERLGFTVSPISHITQMGIANHVILFPPLTEGSANYIELMGTTDLAAVSPVMAEVLKGPPGIRSMVLSGDDVRGFEQHVKTLGFQRTMIADIERTWELPSGEVLEPSFSVMLPLQSEFLFNYCQFHNIAPYKHEAWLDHANGAKSFSAILSIAENPVETSAKYAGILGCEVTKGQAGTYLIGPGKVKMRVGSKEAMTAYLPSIFIEGSQEKNRYLGLSIDVEDISKTADFFKEQQIDYAPKGDSLFVYNLALIHISEPTRPY